MKRRSSLLFLICIIFLLFAGFFVEATKRWVLSIGPSSRDVNVIISKGMNRSEIAQLLVGRGLIEHKWLFIAASYFPHNLSIQAGEYNFPPESSISEILDKLHRGDVVFHKITIPEGLTIKQIQMIFNQISYFSDMHYKMSMEGSLLPETYYYHLGDTTEILIERMKHAMDQVLEASWNSRPEHFILKNKKDVLILASIVEKETALSEERPHIAAVFLNRLKLRMKIQSDPTVIYAASHGEGFLSHPLTLDDLNIVSDFNTYLHDGLPPEPICNPGKASIEAVLHPLDSEDLYFVANGTGGHAFSKSLEDHNRNVAHWRKIVDK